MAYISFQPSDFFSTKLYTGNSSTQSITGVGFQPDCFWVKRRDAAEHPCQEDVIRGAGYSVRSTGTDAQQYRNNDITSFDSDGFSLGSNAEVNFSTGTFVCWNWKAGGSGSSNTDGTITSTVSANTTSGFSIVKWTGTASAGTIGHGLGVAPKVVIVKRYSTSGGGWLMQHGDLTGATYIIKLSTNGAEQNDGANFNSAFPTSSVFSVYNSNNTNASGADHIAYCFAEKNGFSKFGKYTGNGNADGPFVYTGFKPAFVSIKKTSGTGDWYTYDDKRLGYNADNNALYLDLTNAEATSEDIDILSNGFKLVSPSANAEINGSGGNYIYMAFAKSPIVSSNNIPGTAR